MTKDKINKPTEAELEILHVLWENGPSTVRFVNDRLNRYKKTGYTTTLKLMQIMLDKSLLRRDENKRLHTYSSAVTMDEVQKVLLERFLDKTFSGSAHKMVMKALGTHKPNKEELDQIKKLIEELEQENDISGK